MSIRIHKLAEELGMENKELIALLKERKIIASDVKSVSSTVDNISASALLEEFASRKPAAGAPAAEAPAPEAPVAEASAASPSAPPKVNIPTGVFVKSKEDIDREKADAAAAKAAAIKAAQTPSAAPA
ncbi:MAG TPA: translation initiation factor IF-2, partial [Opitutaceae bacterium]